MSLGSRRPVAGDIAEVSLDNSVISSGLIVGGRRVAGVWAEGIKASRRQPTLCSRRHSPRTMTLASTTLTALAVLALSAATQAYPLKVGNNLPQQCTWYWVTVLTTKCYYRNFKIVALKPKFNYCKISLSVIGKLSFFFLRKVRWTIDCSHCIIC